MIQLYKTVTRPRLAIVEWLVTDPVTGIEQIRKDKD